jgi:transcriptional regulator of arginine metabolism
MPSDHEHKETRQREIVSLLGSARVTSQLELVDLLRERGISATQSSVSRDLREMGVGWIGGRYALPADREEREDPGFSEFARFLRGAKPAGPYMSVILTTVGAAQAVGLAMDRAGWPEVVGTMAGDDTVFAATASARDQRRLLQRLDRFLRQE